MIRPGLVALIVALATWDGWRWYLSRIASDPEELGALALTVVFLAAAGAVRGIRPGRTEPIPLVTVSILLMIYALAYPYMPPIVRAALAISATLYCIFIATFGRHPPVAFWGLVALALPVLPSLQFALGYPLRIVSAALTVALLQAQGLSVGRQGTFLVWQGDLLQFDAPCSGVNMLWAGFLLTLMACVLFRFDLGRVLAAIAISTVFAVCANVLRASSLFYLEVGIVTHAPSWWHEAIGIAAFVLAVAATLRALLWLQATNHEVRVALQ
jgi:exosortase/archaeosortase family protein